MEKEKVLEVLKRLGWEPAPPGYPHLAHKRFGAREAIAWWWHRHKYISFEFYSEGRNVAQAAGCTPKSEEDVIKAAQYAEKQINDSFYVRFLADKE